MRTIVLTVFTLCVTAVSQEPTSAPVARDNQERARASVALELIRKEAKLYAIRPEGARAPLELEPGPLLKTSSPVMGSLHGGLFVWTSGGRPAVVAHIYKWYSPHQLLGVAFHSLTREKLIAEREGKVVWSPSRAGIQFKPVPGAPAPADSPAARLRQMRALAAQFSANHTTPEGVTRELRLLTQPVYRYRDTGPDLIDGALFAFVQVTDPEVLVLVEARRDDHGKAAWEFAFWRDTFTGAKASHKGLEVWSVPLIPLGPGSKFYDPAEPYMELVFQPGQGLNPTGAADPSLRSR
jgi:hypothetical protein